MISRKKVNVLKKNLQGKLDVNVIPRNYIKQIKIISKQFQDVYSSEKTNTVSFNFKDYEEGGSYPATNSDLNEQPVILEDGEAEYIYDEYVDPTYSFCYPGFPSKAYIYKDVKVVLTLKDYSFAKSALQTVFNWVRVKLKYTKTTQTYKYDPEDSYSQVDYVGHSFLEESKEESTSKIINIDQINTSESVSGYDNLLVRCSDYELIGNEIHIKLFIKWKVVEDIILKTHSGSFHTYPIRTDYIISTLDSLDVLVVGDRYDVEDKEYIFGDNDTEYVFETSNSLINNFTVFGGDLLVDYNEPYSTKIFNNYQKGKMYGKTYTTYGKFKSKSGEVILNGVSGKVLEPYDVIYFPEYEILQNKKFVITGIEYSNENNEIEIQFKEFIGLDTFAQTPDFEVLYIRPDMISLPYTPELFAFSVRAYSVGENQIKDVELKIDPDPMELQSGDYFRRTPDTSVEGDNGLYIYKNGVENRLSDVLRYVGNFWETFEQDGYILFQLQNKNQINTKLTNLIHKIETEGDYEMYRCHIKGNLNEINEDLLNEGDCVVIIK